MTRAEVEARHKGSVLVDGFDDAILYVKDGSVHYDVVKCVQILMSQDGMTRDEALDWMDYNVVGVHYTGGEQPTWVGT